MIDLKRFKAFTLAEVLITLAIIGFVAEMTIPTLIQNIQNQQNAIAIKKQYSLVQNAFKNYMAEQNATDILNTELFTKNGTSIWYETSATRQANLDAMVKKYFKTIKTCVLTDSVCSYGIKTIDGVYSYDFKYTSDGYDTYILYAIDGSVISIYPWSARFECSPYNYCIDITVDINGQKLPNKYGRDVFGFYIDRYGNANPWGGKQYDIAQYGGDGSGYWKNDPAYCGTLGSKDMANAYGWGCLARIIENGWEMDF